MAHGPDLKQTRLFSGSLGLGDCPVPLAGRYGSSPARPTYAITMRDSRP